MLDGVVHARRTGAGALKRPVLVALGIRAERQEGDHRFHLATGESAAAWERFLTGPLPPRAHRQRPGDDLCRRWPGPHRCLADRLSGHQLCSAAGRTKSGTCWARSARPTTAPSRLPSTPSGTPPTGPRRSVPHAASPVPGKRPTPRPSPACATTSTTCSPASATSTLAQRRRVRTTNAIERRFREVRRRTRPMGTFQDRTSMDRILFAVFIHENKAQGVSTPLFDT